MKKVLFVLLVLLQVCQAVSQERRPIEGAVSEGDQPLEDVHVQNLSSKKYSLSNAQGEFILEVKEGDTLVLSHVGMEDVIRFVSAEDMHGGVEIHMKWMRNQLDEVEISDRSKINAVSLGIIPEEIEKLTMQERRLFTATSGAGFSLDPIINAITGRTKKLRKNVDLEKRIRYLNRLEADFKAYMRDEMGMTEQEIQRFLTYAVEQDELARALDSGNEVLVHFVLQDEWIKFKTASE